MVVWLRPEYILAFVTSLYCCSQLVLSKTYDKFWCATEEGYHQIFCPDETALLTDISIRKVYRRTQMCAPDDHSEYLVHCQSFIDGSSCEGNKTCTIELSSRDYIQCADKTYTPTYFYVKYTCIQIHTMCTDTIPIRNTLYGYIISPAYPHPMADNLTCSMTIEADPSMYIELSPIQIRLQEAMKCRTEFIEILGYDSSYDENNPDKNINWKVYHTWCGTDRSLNNPLPNTRYLISSNSLYISLRTTMSKKPRYFKIRYKIVPSIARSQYNADGIAIDSSGKEHVSSLMTLQSTTAIIPTTTIIPSLNDSDVKYLNGTVPKRTFKKEIIIGVVAGVIVLLTAIAAGVVIFIFIRRRRSSASSSTGKKTTPTAISNITSKSADKAPLIEQPNNTPTAATKRKLVPERTVQISDVNTCRFKSNESADTKTGLTKPDGSAAKPALTAADSGIYGADLSDDIKPTSKPVPPPPAPDPPKTTPDLPAVPEPVTTVVVNPVPEPVTTTVVNLAPAELVLTVVVNPLSENSTISAIVVPNNVEIKPSIKNDKKELPLDNTIQSAYTSLIDATASENEGATCGSTLQSRRTSNLTQPLLIQESNNIDTVVISEYKDSSSHNTVPFNPLHVILKKDANKYYTTEYI